MPAIGRVVPVVLGVLVAAFAAIGNFGSVVSVEPGRMFPWVLVGVAVVAVGVGSSQRALRLTATAVAIIALLALVFPIVPFQNQQVAMAASSNGFDVVEVTHEQGLIDGSYVLSVRHRGWLWHQLATYCLGEGGSSLPSVRWDDKQRTATVVMPEGGPDLVLRVNSNSVAIVSGHAERGSC